MGLYLYIIKRLKKFDSERFKKHIDIISKNTGKSKTYIKLDWIKNLLLYGVGYTDYFRGDYINLTRKEKKTFVTSKSYYQILKKLNDKEETKKLSDKLVFNNMFKEFIKRDFIDLREKNANDLQEFVREKQVVFAKIINGYGGHGVKKITYDKKCDFKKMYKELSENKQFLIEEAIVQSEVLNEINPYVVNSFRVVTLYKDGEVHILGNALRVNKGSEDVIGCTDDLYFSLGEDGKINSNVVDDYGNVFTAHPLTNKTFSEVKIPKVQEAFEMCKQAAMMLPKVRYIGWDVAFSKNGPCIIEGNEYPGYGIIQFYKLNGSRTGHKKEIYDVLNSKNG